MMAFLPPTLKGLVSGAFFALNTIIWCGLLLPLIFLKVIIPIPLIRRILTKVMVVIAECWITCNDLNDKLTQSITYDISGINFDLIELSMNGSYLVISNHQSWVDIVMLQKAFNRKIPLLRFFLKQELIYVPLLGAAWWGLDFPFMKRYTKDYLKKHPEKRGQDLATTRKTCEKYRGAPISILNFLEGTRFTQAKHDRQASLYKHLLIPKAGGVGFVLEAMGEQFDKLLDITIYYPDGVVTLWELLCGKLRRITLRIRALDIPEHLLAGSYSESAEVRIQTQKWIQDIWTAKDQLLTELSESPQIKSNQINDPVSST